MIASTTSVSAHQFSMVMEGDEKGMEKGVGKEEVGVEGEDKVMERKGGMEDGCKEAQEEINKR